MLAGHIGGKLYEQACVAQANVKRIKDFCIIELLGGDIALT